MKFIVDAHLPFYWKEKLVENGHDAIHTSELPDQNRTNDFEITRISLEEKRIVITKDSDFLDSFLLHHKPYKLVLVRTGNVRLIGMKQLLDEQVDSLLTALKDSSLIELYQDELLIIE